MDNPGPIRPRSAMVAEEAYVGNVLIGKETLAEFWKANNVDAMILIKPQPVSRLFKGSAINKASALAGT